MSTGCTSSSATASATADDDIAATAAASESWTGARARLDQAIEYLHRFYADLDATIEWSAYQYVTAPQTASWAWAPIRRHGLTVPGIRGLYLAGSTVEAPAGIVDVGAWAGMEAARAAMQPV